MTINETDAARAAEETLRRQRAEAEVYGEPKGPLPPRILRRPKHAIEAAAAGAPEPPSPRPLAERDRDGFYGGLTTAEALLRAPEHPELGRVATIDPATGVPLGLPSGAAEERGDAAEESGLTEQPPANPPLASTTGGDTEPPPRDPVPPPQSPTPPPRPDQPERLPPTPTPPVDPLPVSDPPVPEVRFRGG